MMMSDRTRRIRTSARLSTMEPLEGRALFASVPMSPPALLPGDDAPAAASAPQDEPAIARGDDGYLAVWTDRRTTLRSQPVGWNGPYDSTGLGTMTDVFAARLDADGNPVGPVAIPIAQTQYNQSTPKVAWNGHDYLVAWTDQNERFTSRVVATRVSASGQVLDATPIVVATNTNVATLGAWDVSSDGTNWLVAYHSQAGGVFTVNGARISPTGQVLDAGGWPLRQDVVNSYPVFADVVFARDEYLMTWIENSNQLVGRRFDTGLNPIGPVFSVVQTSQDPDRYEVPSSPRVASNGEDFSSRG
jgi:hypothetical protein